VGKDTVSRAWRKVQTDWDAWNSRSLAEEPIVRLILDGTVVRVRLDRKATSISLLVVLGVRADGQKVLLAIKSMGGESTEAWRAALDDLIKRGLRRRKAFIRKWRLKHRAVADSLEEARDRLFTFTCLPPSQWRSARTTNAIERLHEEFKRRIKTQTVLPSSETAAMLFWALLASGQINMRKVDGWQTISENFIGQPIDLAA
jgi:transposase-like protein